MSHVLVMKLVHILNHLVMLFHSFELCLKVSNAPNRFKNQRSATHIPIVFLLQPSKIHVFRLLFLEKFCQLCDNFLVAVSLSWRTYWIFLDKVTLWEYLVY
jgi:hypothetical protein